MADEENAEGEEKAKGGGKKFILLGVLMLVLVGVSVGGTLVAMKLLAPTAEEMTEGEEGAEAEPVEVPRKPAIYFAMKPAIIVSFNVRGRQRLLQAELTLMTREDDVVPAIELHMPMIRNSLVLLIGGQLYEELQTVEGKELLRQQSLAEVQRLLEQELGKPGVEQVMYTSFVMQ